MHCPSCHHENRPDRPFCTECGATLSVACPACGVPVEAGEKFCGGCGERLQTAAPAIARAPAARPELAPVVATASRPTPAALPPALAPAPPRPRHRLAALDWLLLGTLLPVCVFGIVMTVIHGVRGDFVRPPFGVGPAPGSATTSRATASRWL